MHALELRIPPPIVAHLGSNVGVLMATPETLLPVKIRWVSTMEIALRGVAIAIAGVAAFRRAKTTVHPLKAETSSSLVTSGVYRFTRNPMYVGLALILLAWAVFCPPLGVCWGLWPSFST